MISLYEAPPTGYGYARAKDKAFAAFRQLWRVRNDQGMSQRELADRLGRDEGWLSKKLSGPSNWTLKTLGNLADALDGEIEVRIIDLHSADEPRSNYDAYHAQFDSTGLQRANVSFNPAEMENQRSSIIY